MSTIYDIASTFLTHIRFTLNNIKERRFSLHTVPNKLCKILRDNTTDTVTDKIGLRDT